MEYPMGLDMKKLKILVVDDNKPIRDLLSAVLEGFGVGKISMASNGEQGYQIFQRERPDIVVVDWEMEPLNGLGLTKRIRTDPSSVDRMIPIILLTGYSAVNRVARARDCGITEYITKPFTANDIAKRISSI